MSLQNLRDFIETRDRFLLTTHHDPDADGLGSEVGLFYLLKALKKEARILNSDRAPSKFNFFDPEEVLESIAQRHSLPKDLAEWNLIILDTSDLGHLGDLGPQVIGKVQDLRVIDHHTNLSKEVQGWVDESASATAQMVYELYESFKKKPPKTAATAILTGIVFDTGSFIYPKTTPRTFEIARKLTMAGAIPKEIHSQLYETIDPSRMRLNAKVQATMEILFHNTIAFQYMTQKMLQETASHYEDSDNLVNYPLKCHTVKVSVFLKETSDGNFKCSMRSKGNIDVSHLAIFYGGGGHRNAAGFPCPPGPLEASKRFILELAESLILEDMKIL